MNTFSHFGASQGKSRTTFATLALLASLCLIGPSEGEACEKCAKPLKLTNCRARVEESVVRDNDSGGEVVAKSIVVDAEGVHGGLRWGASKFRELNVFFDAQRDGNQPGIPDTAFAEKCADRVREKCLVETGSHDLLSARACPLGKPNSHISTVPPPSCKLYLADDQDYRCETVIANCTPSKDRPADPDAPKYAPRVNDGSWFAFRSVLAGDLDLSTKFVFDPGSDDKDELDAFSDGDLLVDLSLLSAQVNLLDQSALTGYRGRTRERGRWLFRSLGVVAGVGFGTTKQSNTDEANDSVVFTFPVGLVGEVFDFLSVELGMIVAYSPDKAFDNHDDWGAYLGLKFDGKKAADLASDAWRWARHLGDPPRADARPW